MEVRDYTFEHDSSSLFTWAGILSIPLNSLSMTFPVGEKFFIQSVRQYLDQIPASSRSDVEVFFKQEARHSREHNRFNLLMERAGVPLKKLEETALNRLKKVGSTPERALAVTVSLEMLTDLGAKLLLNNRWILPSNETANMWRWHAVEEKEHAHVAKEVQQLVSGIGRLEFLSVFIQSIFILILQTVENSLAQRAVR